MHEEIKAVINFTYVKIKRLLRFYCGNMPAIKFTIKPGTCNPFKTTICTNSVTDSKKLRHNKEFTQLQNKMPLLVNTLN
jgi:hypothetical protein